MKRAKILSIFCATLLAGILAMNSHPLNAADSSDQDQYEMQEQQDDSSQHFDSGTEENSGDQMYQGDENPSGNEEMAPADEPEDEPGDAPERVM